jgi:type IV secretory pathway VirB10-like protein
MSMKTSLSLGAFAIVALLVAGVSYWAIRENSQSGPPPSNVAEAPRPPVQSPPAPESSPPVQEKRTAESPAPQTSPPSTVPAAPMAPSGTATASAAPGQSSEATSENPPPSAAVAMPDEEKMSAANRRQVQEALPRRGYYDGPVDGIFGPMTRAAIRRFQDSIGERNTGYLTAAEASRLVSKS